MNQNNYGEIILGAVVIAVAVGFFLFIYVSTGGARPSDYELTAKMAHADGLAVGSDVRIGGVQVGSISGMSLDGYMAAVRIRIRDDIPIPKDSSLSVATGMFSTNSSLVISPGKSKDMLPPGAAIQAS